MYDISTKKLKFASLSILVDALNEINSTKCDVLIFTAAGSYKGSISNSCNTDTSIENFNNSSRAIVNLDSISTSFETCIKQLEEEHGELNYLDVSSSITLINVTFYLNGISKHSMVNPSVTFDQIHLFVDQIIGYTLIPKDFSSEE
ncbi:hypothetical protein J1C67_14615 [Clostridium gasigenes]|uniref:hypothetical protein n=1 Tax=Clostridium gasigenes TaxID=94869 RepID=UPI0014382DF8|nr:hypothetical protein [Clostridium gasigenes]NKF05316.1 hypothetical protein [Clostridium gasigenes]QSW18769.1 hypothetical protein J1C67_14615 [Clostridium gasigenes]